MVFPLVGVSDALMLALQVRAMLSVLKEMGWEHVCLLHSDDSFGR